MLPPATRRSGLAAHLTPAKRLISAATAARGRTSHRAAASGGGGQLCQPCTLSAQERPEAEAIVERAEAGEIGEAAPQGFGTRPERHVAGDLRQAAREIDRLAMLGEARGERARTAHPKTGEPAQVPVELIERGECLHDGCGGA